MDAGLDPSLKRAHRTAFHRDLGCLAHSMVISLLNTLAKGGEADLLIRFRAQGKSFKGVLEEKNIGCVVELQDHREVWLGRNLKAYPIPFPLPYAGTPPH